MVLRVDDLYRLKKNDLLRACSVLSKAFYHDPLWTRVFEGIPDFDRRFGTFFETPLRFCHSYGAVYASSVQLEGLAAVVPGEYADMTMWRILRSGALLSSFKLGVKVAKRMSPMGKVLPRDRVAHMGNRSFQYLFILAVAPEFQGKGLGKKMLTRISDVCDAMKEPIYLETETESNVRMYEYFGFDLLKEIVLEGLGVPMWEMVREPR